MNKNQEPLTTLKGRYRLHQFPPLRSRGLRGAQSPNKDYQQQLMDGFKEGLDKGFAQGMEQGRVEGLEEGRAQGHDQGYRDGFAEGSLTGQAEGRRQFSQASSPLDAIAHEANDYLAHYQIRQREELLQLVEKVTRQVIRCELALQPSQLLALVEEALGGMATPPTSLSVFLNPTEFQRIKDVSPEKVEEWGLQPMAELEMGECRVVTELSEVDVGCEHRLDQCISVLKESLLPAAKDE